MARAFGFSVPPKVNLAIGAGLKGSSSSAGGKKRRAGEGEEQEQEQEIDAADDDVEQAQGVDQSGAPDAEDLKMQGSRSRDNTSDRRNYKKNGLANAKRQRFGNGASKGAQWSR